MAPLKPAVSSSKAGAEDACALTSSSHYIRLKNDTSPLFISFAHLSVFLWPKGLE